MKKTGQGIEPRVKRTRPERDTALWKLIEAWLSTQPDHMHQRALAQKIGVSTSTVTYWKYGEGSPNPDHLDRLATITGYPYGELIAAVMIDMGYFRDDAELLNCAHAWVHNADTYGDHPGRKKGGSRAAAG